MTAKELLTDEALEQVVGGGEGYVYYHDNGDSFSAVVCNRPLSSDEIKKAFIGMAPTPTTKCPDSDLDLALYIDKGAETTQHIDSWTKRFGHLNYTLV